MLESNQEDFLVEEVSPEKLSIFVTLHVSFFVSWLLLLLFCLSAPPSVSVSPLQIDRVGEGKRAGREGSLLCGCRQSPASISRSPWEALGGFQGLHQVTTRVGLLSTHCSGSSPVSEHLIFPPQANRDRLELLRSFHPGAAPRLRS